MLDLVQRQYTAMRMTYTKVASLRLLSGRAYSLQSCF